MGLAARARRPLCAALDLLGLVIELFFFFIAFKAQKHTNLPPAAEGAGLAGAPTHAP
jgi:hypothetical protein